MKVSVEVLAGSCSMALRVESTLCILPIPHSSRSLESKHDGYKLLSLSLLSIIAFQLPEILKTQQKFHWRNLARTSSLSEGFKDSNPSH